MTLASYSFWKIFQRVDESRVIQSSVKIAILELVTRCWQPKCMWDSVMILKWAALDFFWINFSIFATNVMRNRRKTTQMSWKLETHITTYIRLHDLVWKTSTMWRSVVYFSTRDKKWKNKFHSAMKVTQILTLTIEIYLSQLHHNMQQSIYFKKGNKNIFSSVVTSLTKLFLAF
jgi:hypothetical protein